MDFADDWLASKRDRTREELFNPEVFAKGEEKIKRKKLARPQTMATNLNYQLVPQS